MFSRILLQFWQQSHFLLQSEASYKSQIKERTQSGAGVKNLPRFVHPRYLFYQTVNHQQYEQERQIHTGVAIHLPGNFVATALPNLPGCPQ